MIWRIDAAAAADGERCALAPASLLIATHIPSPCHGQASSPDRVFDDPVHSPFSCTLLALAHPSEIDRHPAATEVPPERHLRFPMSAITPALVNAHTHLDLTHIGPRPYSPEGGFVGWAMSLVRPNRATTLDAALASLREGIRRSHAGGVVAIGDIIGAIPNHSQDEDPRVTLARELRNHFGPYTAAYAEVFGYGPSQPRALAELESLAAAGCDLQPHAPYSVAPSVYTRAAELARTNSSQPRLCTHLAETPDERRFIQKGKGPFKELLERIGLWNNDSARDVGHGQHPIEHLISALISRTPAVPLRESDHTNSARRAHRTLPGVSESSSATPGACREEEQAPEGRHKREPSAHPPSIPPLLAAHVNDCPQHLIPLLKQYNISVAYCPRAHTYFQHPTTTGPHQYREMLEAGVNVCLATDSIINLPESQSNRISPLDDARLLFHRDHADARTLLAMVTTRGARALNLNPAHFTLGATSSGAPQNIAGLIAIDISATPNSEPPAKRIMQSEATPTLIRWHQTTPA